MEYVVGLEEKAEGSKKKVDDQKKKTESVQSKSAKAGRFNVREPVGGAKNDNNVRESLEGAKNDNSNSVQAERVSKTAKTAKSKSNLPI